MYVFPNKRGSAIRSVNKLERIGSHVPVLDACIMTLLSTLTEPVHLREHGMGGASTRFFHSVSHVASFVSFEHDPRWLSCCTCGRSNDHVIVDISSVTDFETFDWNVGLSERTLCLVDGAVIHRILALRSWAAAGAGYIIEHDAETFSEQEVNVRRIVATEHCYDVFQYVGACPESIVMVKRGMSVPTNVQLVEF